MRRNNAQDWYAGLLRLYPKSYQKRFTEPMQQTFNDMYHDHMQRGDSTFNFIIKTYADTGLAIVKEHSKEVVMSTKNKKLLVAVGLVGVLAIAVTTVFLVKDRQEDPVIAPWSTLEQARAASKAQKDVCLADDQQAAAAVEKDDTFYDEEKTLSKFEMTASEGIIDVPAGTEYEVTTFSYDGTTATGSLAYDGNYGSYNYTIKKGSDAGSWKFISMTACE